jgi:hypothetical protein
MSHLVVSISGHGFGHVAQTAPVLDTLLQLMPELRLTIRSSVPIAHLRNRISAPFEHMQSEGDIGLLMTSALDISVADSRRAYQQFHANWDERVANEAALLRELKADFVFSNVGYLPLAGAQRAGIANAALCSLNWYDIYRHYCGNDEVATHIHSSYAHADAFLRTTPSMAMESLENLTTVTPIADIGRNRREELAHRFGISPQEKLVLVSMGGIATRLPIEDWPHSPGTRFLVPESWQVQHPDVIPFNAQMMSFNDLLASCDVLLCKPGYGSFVEAACSGIPVLYVHRGDWPESPALIAWLQQHGVGMEISREQLEQGNLSDSLHTLLQLPRRSKVIPTGHLQVAEWLAQKLG